MKNLLILIFTGILFSMNTYGKTKFASRESEPTKNQDFTLGYVPKSGNNAIKGGISINNIILKRIGFYSSIEKGLSSDYFSNTYGINVTANNLFYLWGGLNFDTLINLISNENSGSPRKEIGIGITPYKMTVIRVGWSKSAGPTIAAGIKIPL